MYENKSIDKFSQPQHSKNILIFEPFTHGYYFLLSKITHSNIIPHR